VEKKGIVRWLREADVTVSEVVVGKRIWKKSEAGEKKGNLDSGFEMGKKIFQNMKDEV
jgi:hypothetical protein